MMFNNKLRRYRFCLIFISLILSGIMLFIIHSAKLESFYKKPGIIKIGLVFSPSTPYQLRQALAKKINACENLRILFINTGYRVFDKDMKTSSALEKIEQLIDIKADAVGLVYLDREEQEKCLELLSRKGIPSFVISRDTAPKPAENACYFCYNDTNQAMATAGRYIYSITEHKERVAVVTDTKPEHKKMALAFTGQYCKMAKLDKMDIYAVNVPSIPQRLSALPPSKPETIKLLKSFGIMGMREMINLSRLKNAAACAIQVGDRVMQCESCGHIFYNNWFDLCPVCGGYANEIWPSFGNMKEEQNIDSAISQIEKSKIETIYVIGDVAPLIANRRLMNQGYKGVKMVATGCELLTLASINGGNITANVEPDWRDMGKKFIDAIDCHFNNDLTPGKESVSYIPKDYRYYSENSPLELPMGKGARKNKTL